MHYYLITTITTTTTNNNCRQSYHIIFFNYTSYTLPYKLLTNLLVFVNKELPQGEKSSFWSSPNIFPLFFFKCASRFFNRNSPLWIKLNLKLPLITQGLHLIIKTLLTCARRSLGFCGTSRYVHLKLTKKTTRNVKSQKKALTIW